jgi:hypothetical protein
VALKPLIGRTPLNFSAGNLHQRKRGISERYRIDRLRRELCDQSLLGRTRRSTRRTAGLCTGACPAERQGRSNGQRRKLFSQ